MFFYSESILQTPQTEEYLDFDCNHPPRITEEEFRAWYDPKTMPPFFVRDGAQSPRDGIVYDIPFAVGIKTSEDDGMWGVYQIDERGDDTAHYIQYATWEKEEAYGVAKKFLEASMLFLGTEADLGTEAEQPEDQTVHIHIETDADEPMTSEDLSIFSDLLTDHKIQANLEGLEGQIEAEITGTLHRTETLPHNPEETGQTEEPQKEGRYLFERSEVRKFPFAKVVGNMSNTSDLTELFTDYGYEHIKYGEISNEINQEDETLRITVRIESDRPLSPDDDAVHKTKVLTWFSHDLFENLQELPAADHLFSRDPISKETSSEQTDLMLTEADLEGLERDSGIEL